jgi:glutamate/tyrosine decarboxylase-like PLP-dependent enzyme
MNRTPFPAAGRPRAELLAALEAMKAGDADWRGGRVPLYVFGATEEVTGIGKAAFDAFFTENALGGKRAFASLRRMEEEVIGMGLDLFHAPEGARGTMTVGGTESILLAVKAARDLERARRGRRFAANLVMPVSAHPAFDKAAALMDLEVRRIALRPDFRADPSAIEAAVDADTALIVGSAPCFPYGVVDDIPALGEVASRRGVALHVDACVGGYVANFARELGEGFPAFDFAVPAVSSLSADLHKFGFCPKPASTVFFRDERRAAAGGFDLDVWPNGRFATATFVGTRPGGAVAAAWAVLRFLGREGYLEITRRLLGMRRDYEAGIAGIDGLAVLGRPDLSILAVAAEDPALDVFRVADGMAARGWVPGLLRDPPALHSMMSLLHEPARARWLHDVSAAVAEARHAAAPARAAAEY